MILTEDNGKQRQKRRNQNQSISAPIMPRSSKINKLLMSIIIVLCIPKRCLGLITDESPRTILDVGSGSGDIARQCIKFVERVDAVDCSQAMIDRGKQLENGDHPHLNWICGKVEEVPLHPPYALITAGLSIHWTDWSLVFPRFRDILTPNGLLVLIDRKALPMPWHDELKELYAQFATRQEHPPSEAHEELEIRGFFQRRGEKKTVPIPFTQSVDDYIEGLHSRSGLSRERMGLQKAEDFDR
jgi:ubiquinone/menaquinone biosynthesis C-methylase UbiE